MIKVAVLDDYQNIFQQIVDISKYKNKFEFKVFNNSFSDEGEAKIELEDYDALFIMRERTPMTKSLIEGLPKLKYIITCLLYTSPSPRDRYISRMPSSA